MRAVFVWFPHAMRDDIVGMDEWERVEQELLSNPRAGEVIRGAGGARKLRVRLAGRGKSRSARTIYVYLEQVSKFYFLVTYAKNESDDLSASERQTIAALIRTLEEEAEMRRRMALGLGPTLRHRIATRLDT